MYSPRVYDCLTSLVGWEQPISDCIPAVEAELTQSETGLYAADFHPLLRQDAIRDLCPNYAEAQTANYTALPLWDALNAYTVGQEVRQGLASWRAVQAVAPSAIPPSFSNTAWRFQRWEPTKNGYLAEVRRNAAKHVLQRVFEDKINRGLTKSVLNEQRMFEGIGHPNSTEPAAASFVGVEVRVLQGEGVKIVIDQIGLQLSQPQTLNIYVYHRSQAAPLRTIPCVIGPGYAFQWTNLTQPIEIYANELDLSPGETYLIGYYQEDLLGFAINKTSSLGCFFSKPCVHCNHRYEFAFWEQYSRWVTFRPISVASNNLSPTRDLPTLGDNDQNLLRTWNKTYGLNFRLSVKCELDTFICRNRMQLGRAMGLQIAVLVLKQAEAMLRINNTQKQAALMIAAERENQVDSVFVQLDEAYKAVSFEYSDFNSPCLPCENRPGVKYSAI